MTCELAVLEDGESVLVEVGNHALLVVDHGRVQQNLLHIGMENKASGFHARFLALGCFLHWILGIRRCLTCRRLTGGGLRAAGRSLRRVLSLYRQAERKQEDQMECDTAIP